MIWWVLPSQDINSSQRSYTLILYPIEVEKEVVDEEEGQQKTEDDDDDGDQRKKINNKKIIKKKKSGGIKGYHGFQAQTDVRYLTWASEHVDTYILYRFGPRRKIKIIIVMIIEPWQGRRLPHCLPHSLKGLYSVVSETLSYNPSSCSRHPFLHPLRPHPPPRPPLDRD